MGMPIFCCAKMKSVEEGFDPEGLCSLDSLTEAWNINGAKTY